MNTADRDEAVTLKILDAIDAQDNVSQRHLADRLGVALGLANLYLKRCVLKGLVKVTQAPANRYLYYLTPKGFAEKSRLTSQYLSTSFELYRLAGREYSDLFEYARQRGWHRVAFCGISELAEIAYLRIHEFPLAFVGTFEPHARTGAHLRMPVWRQYGSVPEHDACVMTALTNPAAVHEQLRGAVEAERILIPPLLRFMP